MKRYIAEHRCVKVAVFEVEPPREMWLGALLDSLPEAPTETHCLHMSVDGKTVVMLLDYGDAMNFAQVARVINGAPIDPAWVEERAAWAVKKAGKDDRLVA